MAHMTNWRLPVVASHQVTARLCQVARSRGSNFARLPSVSFIPHSICLSTAMFNDLVVILMHIGDILGIIGGKQHKTTNFWHHFPAAIC